MEFTGKQLAGVLEEFSLTVRDEYGQATHGVVMLPGQVAKAIIAQLSANAAHEGVVDAHICCEHVPDDRELAAMAAILRLMEAHPFDPHAVIRALYPLDGPALPRVLRWFLARFPDPADLPF